MDIDGIGKTTVPEPALEQQLRRAGDYDLLKHLVRLTLPETVPVGPPSDAEAVAVGAICAFLYSLFAVLPMNVVITGLAYTAQLVPHLWPYMKQCHKFNTWPAMELVGRSTAETQLSGESLGWMLPLSVFCPVYRVLLLSIDNEEFYELQRPIPLDDIVLLVTIVKEALWQLLWVLSSKGPTGPVQKHVTTPPRIFSSLSFRQRISSVASRVLAEVCTLL
jgi:ubiquitin-protein ligase E3 C